MKNHYFNMMMNWMNNLKIIISFRMTFSWHKTIKMSKITDTFKIMGKT